MRFTKYQYQEAIKNLALAMEQIDPNGNPCSICGDSGHMAFECGFNPLVAVTMCKLIADTSQEMHNYLHFLAGHKHAFGVQLGPARVAIPPVSEDVDPNRQPLPQENQ